MHIQWRLPRANGIHAVGWARTEIEYDARTWAEKYDIDIEHIGIKNWCVRLCLSTEQDYVDFLVSFNPEHAQSESYELIRD